MHPFQIFMLVINLIGFVLLLWRGAAVDRWAAVASFAAVVGSMLVVELHVDGFRYGVLLVDIALFGALWLLAERGLRWWLVACAGFQLINVFSHLGPYLAQERLGWAAVTVQWVVWTLFSLVVFLGLWEIEADRRFVREGRDGARMDHGGGSGASAAMEQPQG